MPFWSAIANFFRSIGTAWKAADTLQKISYIFTAVTAAVGVKGYLQARDMLAKGQDIMANKVAAGGKLPIIYGNRRVGSQVVYMDTASNSSQHLFVVYALSVGEVDEIMLETLEIDGNSLNDPNQFRNGGYLGSDKIASGAGSLCTANQTSGSVDLAGGTFGTNPALGGYRYVFNAHHGAATQTADPMLVASNSSKWTTAHKLNGVAYIAASFIYDSKGQFSGVPQITVQVKGKKVYDQRKDSTNGGTGSQRLATPSTYEFSNNPAICFQDYILNNDYGKGIPSAKVNFSTFTTAANKADTLVDQPYFNGSAQTLNWSGVAGDNFISITGGITQWWQNKIGELLTLFDANGNGVLDASEIREARRVQFFDESEDLRIYIGATLGNSYSSQAGTSLLKVKRFQCNGYVDGNKTVMENAKELLANMRGVFLYVNGQYELNIEDTGSSTFSITDQHIISDSGISVDYGNKDKKANKVIVEFFNGNKKYELDTATVLHSATTDANDFTSDDGGEVLEIKAEFPFISDPYVAHNMGKAILTRSRNQTTVQFLGTPEMYKLNVNDIVTLTYAGLGFSGKVFRVEAMELQSNGLVSVSLIEYFDVYTWEVPPQEPVEKLANIPSAYAVKAPTGLAFTDTDSSSTSRPFLSWNLPTDFPTHQFRINIVNSAGNQVKNQIVDVNNCDLNFLPVDANYLASVTSLNSTGVESSPVTLPFTIGDAPTDTPDIKNNAITNVKINDLSATKINTGELNLGTAPGMAVKQGKTGYTDNTTTGLWLGNDGGTTKLNIGSSTKYLRFDGTNLFVAGDISASTGTISNSIAIGSGNNIFKADANGIYLGNTTFGSAPFRVSMAGALTATNATISGSITATALNVTNATVTGTLDASVITLNNEPLDNVLSYSEVGGIGLLTLNEVANVNGDFVVNGDFEAVGASPELVIGKVSSSDSHTDSATADIRLVSQQATNTIKIQKQTSNGSLTTKLQLSYDPLSKALLSTDNLLKINTGGSLALTLDASQNAIFAGEVKSNALELVSSTPSTTTNKIYNVGGTLYFNGSAVGGGGTGDITSVVAGTNLNGGGTSGAVTLNLDNTISITGAISSGTVNISEGVSSGTFISLRRSAGEIGKIGYSANDNVAIYGTTASHGGLNFIGGGIIPMSGGTETDNAISLGDASRNFSEIFAKGMTVGSTQVIDASRNLTNIGTISSGAITSTGYVTAPNAKMGVWSANGSYSGIFHTSHASTGYAIIFDANSTFIGSGSSGTTHIRYNNNTSANQLKVNSSGWSMGETVVMDGSRNLTNIAGLTITSSLYSSTLNYGLSGSRTFIKNDAGAIASQSGFFETSIPTNYYSGATSWQHLIEARHSNNSNNYAMQIAGQFFNQEFYGRKTNNSGTTAWSQFAMHGTTVSFSEVRSTGNVTAYYSDERLKDFTGKIDNAVDKVKQLNGYYFKENQKAKKLGYKNDKQQVGVNAQEVQKVLPEVIDIAPISHTEGVDEEYLTVHYEKLVPLLIEAIKDQQRQIDELNQRISA